MYKIFYNISKPYRNMWNILLYNVLKLCLLKFDTKLKFAKPLCNSKENINIYAFSTFFNIVFINFSKHVYAIENNQLFLLLIPNLN